MADLSRRSLFAFAGAAAVSAALPKLPVMPEGVAMTLSEVSLVPNEYIITLSSLRDALWPGVQNWLGRGGAEDFPYFFGADDE